MFSHQLSEIIKQRRQILRIGPDDLAEIAGVGRRTLFYMEEGNANPSLETMTKVLDVLGTELKIVLKNEPES